MSELLEITRILGGIDCRFLTPQVPPSPIEIDEIKLEIDEFVSQGSMERLVLHLDNWLYLPSQFLGVMIAWTRLVSTVELVNPPEAVVEVLDMTKTLPQFVCRQS